MFVYYVLVGIFVQLSCVVFTSFARAMYRLKICFGRHGGVELMGKETDFMKTGSV